jgi:hypothetical protein
MWHEVCVASWRFLCVGMVEQAIGTNVGAHMQKLPLWQHFPCGMNQETFETVPIMWRRSRARLFKIENLSRAE